MSPLFRWIISRTSSRRPGAGAILFLALAWAASPLAGAADDGRADDTARFLAGMPLSGNHFESLAATEAWKTHCRLLDQEFGAYEERTLKPLRDWAEAEIAPKSGRDGVVRYLFSGPDILHALAAYPEGKTFILGGLEPVGAVPDLDKLSAGGASGGLAELRQALGEIIQFSFFRTEDMKEELRQTVFPGTIPILTLFLARSGQAIEPIERLSLQKDGSLAPAGEGGKNADAVRIRFYPKGKQKQSRTLLYFSANVADGDVKRSGFLAFLESQPRGGAYLKAASYLMHKQYFSQIRNHLLNYSTVLLQDDSGIPFGQFPTGLWDIALYGSYVKPIDLFAEHYQEDLRRAYLESSPKKLDFGAGYLWRKDQSNLMRAVRKPLIARPVVFPVVEN